MTETSADQATVAAVIYAKNLTRISDFYATVLGAKTGRRAEDHVVLELPGFQLVIVAIPGPAAQDIEITSPPARRTQTPLKLTFPVDSIGRLRRVAAELGGQVDPPEREWQFGPDLVCDGHDPEGNVLQLRERLG